VRAKIDPKKPLFVLIDANALVHRAYHAFPSSLTISTTGEQINAVYGFTRLLLDVLEKFKPKYVICAFDTKGPTIRHSEFASYKSNRKPMDENLVIQIPYVKKVVEALNIPRFEVEGYEADDIIGTLTKREYEVKNLQELIVTGDHDLLQLIDSNTLVYMAGGSFRQSKLYGKEEVIERYGFGPEYIIDYKALSGDPSDNIPGVSGIGQKTACDLIKRFGHIDQIYLHLDEIKERYRKKLEVNYEIAKKSEQLATIITDSPLEFFLRDALLAEYDIDTVRNLFQKLEFRSLINRLPKSKTGKLKFAGQKNFFTAKQKKRNILPKNKNSKEDYSLIKTKEDFQMFYEELSRHKQFAFDVESNGLDYLNSKVLGISFCWEVSKAYYITRKLLSDHTVISKLKKVFENSSIAKISHNLKFDTHFMKNLGIGVNGTCDDTLVAAYLLQAGEGRIGLKELAFNKLGMLMSTLEELAGTSNLKKRIEKIDEDELGLYSCADSDATFRLYNLFKKELNSPSNQKLYKLYKKIEMPLVPILMRMERIGIKLDSNYLAKLKVQFETQIQKLKKEIFYYIGHEINLNSPKQLGEWLFSELKLPSSKRTKTGNFSTNESVLRDLVSVHPSIEKILDYRELEKLKSTYTDALINKIDKSTSRLHTVFNQTITSTGRLSSSDPNLQNIPISSDTGMKIRRAFIAENGKLLLDLDIAQQELRVAASLSKEEKLIDAFRKNIDIHALTASHIFDKSVENISKKERRIGKTLNFSLLYGISAFGLANRLKIDVKIAQAMIDEFWQSYPRLHQFFINLVDEAKKKGYVETIFGRRRNAKGLLSSNFQIRSATEREIINFPIQGTSADLMKAAMIGVDEYLGTLRGLNATMILQVHDELILEIDKKSIEKVRKLVKDLKDVMEGAMRLDVPLIVEPKIGTSWAKLDTVNL